jgi:hypothetical protein
MRLKHSRSNQGGGALTQIVVFLLCAGAMLSLGWIMLLPGLFTSVIQNRTGFPAKIDYFYANPFTSEVRMRGLAIMNPAGFAAADCLEVHQFTAKADLFSLLGGAPVLDMSTIDVTRVTVVTNADGVTNLDLMSRKFVSDSGLKPNAGGKSLAASRTPAPSPFQFLVRKLDIRLNEVVLKDERQGKTAQLVHSLGFKRSYNDVTPETKFNADLPEDVVAAGKEVGERVSGGLKRVLANTTQPIPHQTYAWGEKAKKDAPAPAK